jgi:hypothetical protein
MSIDMTDIVLDGDLGQNGPIQVMRATRYTDQSGHARFGNRALVPDVFGVIVPATGRQLQRLAEVDRVSSGIAVYTTIPLSVGSDTMAPDKVIYEGKTYLAQYIDDFAQYGFTATVCIQQDMQAADVSVLTPS